MVLSFLGNETSGKSCICMRSYAIMHFLLNRIAKQKWSLSCSTGFSTFFENSKQECTYKDKLQSFPMILCGPLLRMHLIQQYLHLILALTHCTHLVLLPFSPFFWRLKCYLGALIISICGSECTHTMVGHWKEELLAASGFPDCCTLQH